MNQKEKEKVVNALEAATGSNDLIYQKNAINEACCKLTSTQYKLVYLIISFIDKEDTEFKTYHLGFDFIRKKLKMKNHNSNREIINIIRSLRKRELIIGNSEVFTVLGWFNSADFDLNNKTVLFRLDDRLKPYLLKVNDEPLYFGSKFKSILPLKSIYSIRIYQIIKQYQCKDFNLNLDSLRFCLDLNDKYKKIKDFKKRVLDVAKKEIKEKTEIYFEYKNVKKGKEITGFKFTVFKKDQVTIKGKEIIHNLELNIPLEIRSEYSASYLTTSEKKEIWEKIGNSKESWFKNTDIRLEWEIKNFGIGSI